MSGLPEITEIRRLTVRPGDRLICRIDHYIDQAEHEALAKYLRYALPAVDDVKIVILDGGVNLEVLSPHAEDGQ